MHRRIEQRNKLECFVWLRVGMVMMVGGGVLVCDNLDEAGPARQWYILRQIYGLIQNLSLLLGDCQAGCVIT